MALVVLGAAGDAEGAASARLFYGRSLEAKGCPDEAELRRAIAARVGYDPIFAIAPNSVAVSIVLEGREVVADVKLTDREGMLAGSRTLRAPALQCGELTESIALTVAIALDKLEAEAAKPPAAPAPAGQATEAEPALSGSPTAPPEAVASFNEFAPGARDNSSTVPNATSTLPRSRIELRAGIAAAAGLAPSLSLGPTASVSLRGSAWDVGIEGWADLPSSGATDAIHGARVQTSWFLAGPTACLGRRLFFGCALGLVGAVRAEASGVPGASARGGLALILGARVGLDVPVGRGLSLRGSIDLLANPVQEKVIASGQDLWQAAPVAAATQIALAYAIP